MLHSLLAPPGLGEVMSLVFYVLADPYLFIGSTTVMTSGLVMGSALLAATAAFAPRAAGPFAGSAGRALAWLAPKLALVLAYFGLGSMLLATEILIRFHDLNPAGTEMQLRSGVGHLVVAALGIVLLRVHLRGLAARTWVEAHFWALAYLSVHVMVFTPPWFNYQFQGDLVLAVARGVLIAALSMNLVLWRRWASPAPAAAASAAPAR